MGIIDHLVLRGSSSRAVVLGVLGGGVALTGLVVYVRNVEANPVRLGRDNNGVLRWMTRLEQYEARLDVCTSLCLEAIQSTNAQTMCRLQNFVNVQTTVKRPS